MIVQHNITAMNANRMLGLTTGSLAKSTEKLSSGYRINRAADDAAGLSISEKMRKQIRGLDRASTNAEDGISAVQTAEGALTEVHSMLQRMNELAVQASNGTMSSDDRQAVQDEIDKLVDEVDRVAETTKFNETYLLKGDPESKTTTYEAKYKNPLKNTVSQIAGKDTYATGDSNPLSATDIDKYVEVDETGKLKYKEGKVLYKVAGTPGTAVGKQDQDNRIAEADLNQYFKSETNGVYLDAAMKTVASDEDIKNAFDSTTGEYKTKLYQKKGPTDTTASEIGADYIDKYVNVTATTKANPLEFNLHVGAESDEANKIKVEIKAMSANGIGVDVLKGKGMTSEDSATAAIDIIGKAISEVSSQRSALGATQNRLEHTIANLDNVVENTTSAESRIRDTDMAEEMVAYSKNSILQQAGQSMLAQANQANQGVLSLLQ
jgi:flagellin